MSALLDHRFEQAARGRRWRNLGVRGWEGSEVLVSMSARRSLELVSSWVTSRRV